ncbi:MAG: phosphoribosylformylglycinamidine synthase subunit PurL [Saprospiraceae bacterium]
MSEQNSPIPFEIVAKLGLNTEEYSRILEIMGRHPNFTELSIFSVMWSEHCSYKNSIKYLKTLPRDGDNMLVAAGEENAGLIDIGDGLACAFKIESHNHPSAIEPYQGAATGVGGIHRDIFTMGARPIAALNSLRFGDINEQRTKHLVDGVVRGIGDYGNCLGVPTIGGETYFDPCYNQNILVNAMSIGVMKHGITASAIATGDGNPIFIVGSDTGKDGIHGATFASADLTEDSADDLPSVQVGDPFQEKLLLEASLEVIRSGHIIGIQDMGAAGITCSTSEMSAKGEAGMDINLDLCPTRQADMKPFEILLSESQERMLICGKKGKEKEIKSIFDKWDLNCTHIGNVNNSGRLKFYSKGELVADVPAEDLVLGGGAPVYDREFEKPKYLDQIEKFSINDINEPHDLLEVAFEMSGSPNLASKKWIYEQYDSTVRTNSMGTNDPSDAPLIRLKGSDKALAAVVDCNSRYVYADPYKGSMIAVSEAARNIVCSGGVPAAITNCLNFGNPYNKEVYWQFVNVIKGMGEACRKFDTPVTGGNVSFYNQTVLPDTNEPVYPTPAIGMVGILDSYRDQMTLNFKNVGDKIYLIGKPQNDIGQSEYLRFYHKIEMSSSPWFDLDYEYLLQKTIIGLNKGGVLKSAHDISEGGLFFCLLECCYRGNFGFELNPDISGLRKDAYLFGESQSRVVVTIETGKEDVFLKKIESMSMDHCEIGQVTEEKIIVFDKSFGEIHRWKKRFDESLGKYLEK